MTETSRCTQIAGRIDNTMNLHVVLPVEIDLNSGIRTIACQERSDRTDKVIL
jgi:hypothetical protein